MSCRALATRGGVTPATHAHVREAGGVRSGGASRVRSALVARAAAVALDPELGRDYAAGLVLPSPTARGAPPLPQYHCRRAQKKRWARATATLVEHAEVPRVCYRKRILALD